MFRNEFLVHSRLFEETSNTVLHMSALVMLALLFDFSAMALNQRPATSNEE
jgi:hypothetical protein